MINHLKELEAEKYHLLNVIDDFNREGLGIEVDFSFPSQRVIRTLEQIIEWRGKPKMIRSDNGPEYISHELKNWLEKQQIKHQFIELGKLQQNGYNCIIMKDLACQSAIYRLVIK